MYKSLEIHEPYLRIGQIGVKKILFGAGAHTEVGKEVKRVVGKNNVQSLLVTDQGVEKAGLVEKIRNTLKESGVLVDTFNKVEPEPTFRCLREVSELVRSKKFDVVIGLGGGSSMDTAKAASILATNLNDVDYYVHFGDDRVKKKPLTKIMISTTSGTGSVVSNSLVATDEKGFKVFICSPFAAADVSIIDPLMTVTCPPRLTASCGMDALAHLIEAYVNFLATPLSDTFALHGIKLVKDNLQKAVYNGDNLTARYNMAIASMLGGLCTSIVVCNIGHCISEGIGPLCKIPHGVANAVALPHQMLYNLPAVTDRIATLSHYLGVTDTQRFSMRDRALRSIETVKNLVLDVGLPISLKEVGVPKKSIPTIVDRIMELSGPYELSKNNPMKLTVENVTQLVTNLWGGNI